MPLGPDNRHPLLDTQQLLSCTVPVTGTPRAATPLRATVACPSSHSADLTLRLHYLLIQTQEGEPRILPALTGLTLPWADGGSALHHGACQCSTTRHNNERQAAGLALHRLQSNRGRPWRRMTDCSGSTAGREIKPRQATRETGCGRGKSAPRQRLHPNVQQHRQAWAWERPGAGNRGPSCQSLTAQSPVRSLSQPSAKPPEGLYREQASPTGEGLGLTKASACLQEQGTF